MTERGSVAGGRGHLVSRLAGRRETALFVASSLLLLAGVGAGMAGAGGAATGLWVAATLLGLIHSTASLLAAARRRQPSVDVIAWLALVGALGVGEAFAGAVITLMLASGVLLEARAAARARRELSLLPAPSSPPRGNAVSYCNRPSRSANGTATAWRAWPAAGGSGWARRPGSWRGPPRPGPATPAAGPPWTVR